MSSLTLSPFQNPKNLSQNKKIAYQNSKQVKIVEVLGHTAKEIAANVR
ncbi:hypothetical protein [Leptospira santarosai]